MKIKYLDKRCEYCDAILQASQAASERDRQKRDNAKRFCGGPCSARFKQRAIADAWDAFLYRVAV